jgi:hypothetical protein
MRETESGPGVPRRGVLRALALAPAALAACAAGRPAVVPESAAAGDTGAPASPPAAPGPSAGALAVLRGFHLPADAEPASIFRAAAARPGEPR